MAGGLSVVRAGRVLPVLAACSILGLLGCTSTRVAIETLPDQPIAFLYWVDKASQKRSDAFGKVAELPPLPPNKTDPDGQQELEIRAHLRAEEAVQLGPQLAKNPGRLMLYWPRTGKLERLEAAPPNARPLAWSRDHRRLLFASAHRGEREQLYEYHLDRRDLRPLTHGPDEHPRGDYGPEEGLITLSLHRSAPIGAAESTVHLRGAGEFEGRPVADKVPPGTLRLTPKGDQIVYEQVVPRRRTDGPTQYDSFIATRSLAPGSEERMLLGGREPTLTPDGEWIVFASESTAGYRLRRMRLDGTARVAIRPGTDEERMPTVSPDGEFIAFIVVESGKRHLAVRRFDGKAERVLLKDGWSEFPVW
ncbi:MAG: hypothetical protein U0900_03080 [Myxococcota bacterium]